MTITAVKLMCYLNVLTC